MTGSYFYPAEIECPWDDCGEPVDPSMSHCDSCGGLLDESLFEPDYYEPEWEAA